MISYCKQEFTNNYDDFNSNLTNKWEVIDINMKHKLSIYENDNGDDNDKGNSSNNNNTHNIYTYSSYNNGKTVKFFINNGEKLDIQDSQFDLYLCNLCLHITNDYKQMLRECYRVLKKGSQAIFSIWGDKTKSKSYISSIRNLVYKYHDLPIDDNPYILHDNLEDLKKDLHLIGFKNYKQVYINCLFDVFTFDDYSDKLKVCSDIELIKVLKKEEQNKISSEINNLAEEFINSEDFVNLNILVFSVYK